MGEASCAPKPAHGLKPIRIDLFHNFICNIIANFRSLAHREVIVLNQLQNLYQTYWQESKLIKSC